MTYNEYRSALNEAFEKNSLGGMLSDENSEKLYEFSNILIETNKSFNLTAITGEKDIILKHFADCATISRHIPSGSSLIDVGCGAGFPSLPLAILRDDIQVTSLDSTGKKVAFIASTALKLNISNINTVCARAEEFASQNCEKFDVCTSRAVARLNILSELCIPLVKTNGLFIAMKSNKGEDEYAEAKSGIEKLGCRLSGAEKLTLEYNNSSIEREIYVFKKTAHTPKQYPRKYAQILKSPIK